MKTIKQAISLLLITAALALSFSACGQTSDGQSSTTTSTTTTPEATTTQPTAPASVTRGEKTATAYKNDSLGFTFTAPSGWVFYTDEQIAALMNVTADVLKDENLMESAKITTIMDFMVIDPLTSDNVNLSIENLRPSGNTDITVEAYIEQTKKLLKEQMPTAGYAFEPTAEVTLGTEGYVRLTATCTMNGIPMTQYMYLKKIGNHMISITATSSVGTTAETFQGMFS